jgi:transcriptional regulator with XRE-family HTH domain
MQRVRSTRPFPENGSEWEALRGQCDLTRAELARRTSLDPVTIWRLEHDEPVSDRIRLLVGAALGLSVFPPVERVEVGAAA